jgi:hypothetical protein
MMTPRAKLLADFDRIAALYGTTVQAIRGNKKIHHIVTARDECCYTAWQRGMSFTAIGRIFGTDHTTVRNAIGRHMVFNDLGENDMTRRYRSRYKCERVRITPDLTAQIKALDGVTADLVAQELGVPRHMVRNLRKDAPNVSAN